MKRVLFFIPFFHMGGAEKVAVNIMRLLDSTFFEIHCVVVSSDKGPLQDLLPKNTKVHILDASKTIFSIFKLRKIIVETKPEIVFSTLFRTHSALSIALLGLKVHPKVVFRNPTSPKIVLQEKKMSFIELFLLKKVYSNATIILAQTPEMREEIVEFFHQKKDKIYTLINPLDIVEINKSIEKIDNPFNDDYINIVASGRLSQEKGFDTLLQAFKQVIQKNDRFRLNILGRDTGAAESLLKMTKELMLERYVTFWGDQSNPYKFYYYSDLFVLSSRREGLPNTVLENLYLEKPIVATRCIPYMSVLIKEGKNGFLVDVDNIDALASAILKYNAICPEAANTKDMTNAINNLFKNLIQGRKITSDSSSKMV